MKLQKPGTDQAAELNVLVNGLPCTEYLLPVDADDPNTIACFISVNDGDVLTATGHFSGSVLHGSFDLLADGSFLAEKRIEGSKMGDIKHRTRRLDFKDVLDLPKNGPGSGDTQRQEMIEGQLTVKNLLEEVETPIFHDSTGLDLGTLAFFISVNQRTEDLYYDPYPSVTSGDWRDGAAYASAPAGVAPTHELSVTPTNGTISRKRQQKHMRHFAQQRFGKQAWCRFLFHYRSRTAIDNAGLRMTYGQRNDEHAVEGAIDLPTSGSLASSVKGVPQGQKKALFGNALGMLADNNDASGGPAQLSDISASGELLARDFNPPPFGKLSSSPAWAAGHTEEPAQGTTESDAAGMFAPEPSTEVVSMSAGVALPETAASEDMTSQHPVQEPLDEADKAGDLDIIRACIPPAGATLVDVLESLSKTARYSRLKNNPTAYRDLITLVESIADKRGRRYFPRETEVKAETQEVKEEPTDGMDLNALNEESQPVEHTQSAKLQLPTGAHADEQPDGHDMERKALSDTLSATNVATRSSSAVSPPSYTATKREAVLQNSREGSQSKKPRLSELAARKAELLAQLEEKKQRKMEAEKMLLEQQRRRKEEERRREDMVLAEIEMLEASLKKEDEDFEQMLRMQQSMRRTLETVSKPITLSAVSAAKL